MCALSMRKPRLLLVLYISLQSSQQICTSTLFTTKWLVPMCVLKWFLKSYCSLRFFKLFSQPALFARLAMLRFNMFVHSVVCVCFEFASNTVLHIGLAMLQRNMLVKSMLLVCLDVTMITTLNFELAVVWTDMFVLITFPGHLKCIDHNPYSQFGYDLIRHVCPYPGLCLSSICNYHSPSFWAGSGHVMKHCACPKLVSCLPWSYVDHNLLSEVGYVSN